MQRYTDECQSLLASQKHKQAGDNVRATAVLEKALAQGVGGNASYRELGEIYLLRGMYDRAQECLVKAWSLCPEDHWALFKIGLVHKARGEYAQALSLFTRMTKIKKLSAAAHRELGEIWYRKDQCNLAKKHLQKALMLEPQNGAVCYFLGMICIKNNMFVRAEEWFNRALKQGFSAATCNEQRDRARYLNIIETTRRVRQKSLQCGGHSPIIRRLKGAINKEFAYSDPYLKNSALNEIEIASGKTTLASKPWHLWVTLTNRCNLQCRMCSVWRGKKRDLSNKTIREIISLFPSLERVVWLGGGGFPFTAFSSIN